MPPRCDRIGGRSVDARIVEIKMVPHSQSHATGLGQLAGGLWPSWLALAAVRGIAAYVGIAVSVIALCGDASLGAASQSEMIERATLSIDDALGAASQSSVDRLETKVDSIIAIAVTMPAISIVLSDFTLWKLNNDLAQISKMMDYCAELRDDSAKLSNELAPLTTEIRRGMLERSSTRVEVFDHETLVSLTVPTPLPGVTDKSFCFVRARVISPSKRRNEYDERELRLAYDHDGIRYSWYIELPAGKVFADVDSRPSWCFVPPTESKMSPNKTCRFTVTWPRVIDAPADATPWTPGVGKRPNAFARARAYTLYEV